MKSNSLRDQTNPLLVILKTKCNFFYINEFNI